MVSGPVSPLALERYELRYLIPLNLVDPISGFLEAYCNMDYYSQSSKDYFYTINSLYLDNPCSDLSRSKQATLDFSVDMQIRSYGVQPTPCYFEIKYKVRDFVKKKRAKILMKDWPKLLELGEAVELGPDNVDPGSAKNLADFIFIKHTYQAAPVLLSQFCRKSYCSYVDEYARVTIDKDLRQRKTTDWCLQPSGRRASAWVEEPEQNAVLKLKFDKNIPLWMIDLIRKFDLSSSLSFKSDTLVTPVCHIPGTAASRILYR